MMILKDLFRERAPVFAIMEGQRFSEAAAIMQEARVGALVVVDDDRRVTGMLTDRDIAMTLALGAGTPDSYIDEAVSRDVEVLGDCATVFSTAIRFRETGVKRLPVIDEDKRLVGIVSTDDVMTILAREMHDTCAALEPKLGHIV